MKRKIENELNSQDSFPGSHFEQPQQVIDHLRYLIALKNLTAKQICSVLQTLIYFRKTIPMNDLGVLLSKLPELKDISAEYVNNCFRALHTLAKAGKLEGFIDVESLQNLFDNFPQLKDFTSRHLFDLFLHVCNMIEMKCFRCENLLKVLPEQLPELNDFPGQYLGGIMSSLYTLLHSGQLKGKIDTAGLQPLLSKFIEEPVKNNAILKTVSYSLAQLAEADKLQGYINMVELESLLKKYLMQHNNFSAIEYANMLHCFGSLANMNRLQGVICNEDLLIELHNRMLNSRGISINCISDSCRNLVWLIEAGLLKNAVDKINLGALYQILVELHPQQIQLPPENASSSSQEIVQHFEKLKQLISSYPRIYGYKGSIEQLTALNNGVEELQKVMEIALAQKKITKVRAGLNEPANLLQRIPSDVFNKINNYGLFSAVQKELISSKENTTANNSQVKLN